MTDQHEKEAHNVDQTPYGAFIDRKTQLTGNHGFAPVVDHPFLFDFQRALVEWALRKGRAAIFADCGLGKTPMQLAWADNVARHSGKPVIIFTPLAVSAQTCREGAKFGIEAHQSRDGAPKPHITVTNYEKAHLFDPADYAGAVCDESSMLKAYTGRRRKLLTQFMDKMPWRLLCTATAAPNDYVEIGTASEALGHMGQMDMLNTFFRSTDNLNHVFDKSGDFWARPKFILKPHAKRPFWQWVASWARAIRKPSDLGFDDGRFHLPPLNVAQHIVEHEMFFDGELFPRIAVSMREQRAERRRSLEIRCEKVAELCAPRERSIVWCHLNDEGDCLAEMPGAVQVAGSDLDEKKEEAFEAFTAGQIKTLVTKTSIGGFGMNWQHCQHMTFFPSHSFEQYYQGVRRCWRFGQDKPVDVDVVTTPGEAAVTANLRRKHEQAEALFESICAEMRSEYATSAREAHNQKENLPSWLA